MKKLLLPIVISLIFFLNIAFAGIEARFVHDPDIYKGKIVFSYEGDLWIVSSSGGTATRLTSFPGDEFSAKFSPDGKELAFTGEYDGSYNVYVMPVDGAEPSLLTK